MIFKLDRGDIEDGFELDQNRGRGKSDWWGVLEGDSEVAIGVKAKVEVNEGWESDWDRFARNPIGWK